jgi:hypothetical protein
MIFYGILTLGWEMILEKPHGHGLQKTSDTRKLGAISINFSFFINFCCFG